MDSWPGENSPVGRPVPRDTWMGGFLEQSAAPAIVRDPLREEKNMNENRHPLSARFHQILEELGNLHDKKQTDYGRDNDPFSNVRGSEDWEMPAWVGAMVRAQDKVRRLQQFNRKGFLANEGVIDAFQDLAVYAIIAQVLYEQDFARDIEENAR